MTSPTCHRQPRSTLPRRLRVRRGGAPIVTSFACWWIHAADRVSDRAGATRRSPASAERRATASPQRKHRQMHQTRAVHCDRDEAAVLPWWSDSSTKDRRCEGGDGWDQESSERASRSDRARWDRRHTKYVRPGCSFVCLLVLTTRRAGSVVSIGRGSAGLLLGLALARAGGLTAT